MLLKFLTESSYYAISKDEFAWWPVIRGVAPVMGPLSA